MIEEAGRIPHKRKHTRALKRGKSDVRALIFRKCHSKWDWLYLYSCIYILMHIHTNVHTNKKYRLLLRKLLIS